MARPCFPANIWKNVIHEKMKFSFLQQEFFVVFAFYQKGLSIALPCLLVNLNKSMGLRLEFAIRNMRLCCTLAHCSTSTSVKTNRPIGHPQKKHWTCGPKMTTFILKNGHFSKVPWPDLAPVCFFPGTKCTISPTYIIAINLESEMFRQTKFVKIGQLDYWEDFTPCPAPPHTEKNSSARPAPPRSKKRLPCASLHLTLSQSSSYRATLIFLLVERFPFSQFIEHRFPLITSSFEPHWSISMYNLCRLIISSNFVQKEFETKTALQFLLTKKTM